MRWPASCNATDRETTSKPMNRFAFFPLTLMLILGSSPAQSAPAASPGSSTPAPVAPRATYSEVKVDGPYIAMTFDDGPHAKNGNNIPDTTLISAKLVA